MSRVFLEEADRPPPAYYQNSQESPLKIVPFQTPDPEKWVSAPEFVPRSKQLADAFGLAHSDFLNHNLEGEYTCNSALNLPFPTDNPFLPSVMPSATPFTGIPPGYTANMTTINAGNGPPIAAILLRKKRKRRSKQATNSMVNTHSISPCSSHPSDPNGDVSSCDEMFPKVSGLEQSTNGGSCPDLTQQQAQKWDDYLYETAKAVNENGILHESTGERTSEDLSSSVYEIAAPGLLETAAQTVSGTSNKELQKLDEEINGNVMTSSMVLRRLADHTFISDGCTERTLEQEMNDIAFRPPATTFQRYGYPQIDNNSSPYVHLATMDSKKKKVTNQLIDKDALKAYLDEEAEEEEEDFLEGLNITVNNFDNCEDLTLSDVEQPSRFQQFQNAIRKNTVVVATDLHAPDRQCCTIS
uniref:Uncharacterized protein n=1 Tax=Caenorhabditis japonica TaxID=281687 RepID=A0A8R1DZC5_CAEJA